MRAGWWSRGDAVLSARPWPAGLRVPGRRDSSTGSPSTPTSSRPAPSPAGSAPPRPARRAPARQADNCDADPMRSDGRALPDLAQTLVLRQLGLIRTDQLPDLAARVNPGRLRRVTLAALPSRLLVPVLAVHEPGPSGLARRRCALEAVETCHSSRRPHLDSGLVPDLPCHSSASPRQVGSGLLAGPVPGPAMRHQSAAVPAPKHR